MHTYADENVDWEGINDAAAYIGYWLRKPLDWDPVKEHFTNSPEANQLVKANIRGKWKLS